MTDISRKEFIQLTAYTPERFDAKARRHQFPFMLPEMVRPVDGKLPGKNSRYRSYRAIDALITIISDHFHFLHGTPLSEACGLVVDLYGPIRDAWPSICESSTRYYNLMKHETIESEQDLDQVLCGGYRYYCGNYLDPMQRKEQSGPLHPLNWTPMVGTFQQVANQYANSLINTHAVALVSVTLAAAQMRHRQVIHGIDLSTEYEGTKIDFWDADRWSI